MSKQPKPGDLYKVVVNTNLGPRHRAVGFVVHTGSVTRGYLPMRFPTEEKDGKENVILVDRRILSPFTMMDEYVAVSMLLYPSIYPNRMRVLTGTYFVLGNGIEWLEKGVLPPKAKFGDTRMDYTSLDDRIAEMERTYSEDMFDAEYHAKHFNRILDEREELQRREENILELASTPIPSMFTLDYDKAGQWRSSANKAGGYDDAKTILDLVKKSYLPLSNMPQRVERSFFYGAIEALDLVIRSTKDFEELDQLLAYRKSLHAVHERY